MRINERHWLAQDLVFAHSGHCAFVYGEPVAPTATDALNGAVTAGTGADALDGILGWVPDGSNRVIYDLPTALALPLTLSAWWHGTSSTTTDPILCVQRASGYGGVLLRRTSAEVVSAQTWDTAGGANAATASGGYVSGQWQHGVAVFVADNSRIAYADGGNSGTNTGTKVLPTDCTQVAIATDPRVTNYATTAIASIALPLVIARVLSADDVARLHDEQRANPWGLFAERRIWVPVPAAAGGFMAAWAQGANSVIGAGARAS